MLAQQLYDFSARLNTRRQGLAESLNKLLRHWAFRYKFMVDAAPRKFDCPTTQMALRHFNDSKEVPIMIGDLLELRAKIDDLIEELRDVRTE